MLFAEILSLGLQWKANVEGGEQRKIEICHANIRKHMNFLKIEMQNNRVDL